MKPQTVDMPPLSVRAEVGSVNDEKRTVSLIFSTGAAVTRTDFWSGKQYREVLSLDPKHVRLERLNGGAPLLDGHAGWSVGDVLGAVEQGSARIEKGLALADVRFSKRDSVEPIWQDVKDGILRSVSVGYRVYKFQEDTPKDGGIPTRTAIDWEPFEVSLVPMPADAGAKVRSGDKSDTNACVILTRDAQETSMTEETKPSTPAADAQRNDAPAGPSAEQVRAEAISQERARITGIQDAVRVAGLEPAVAADMVGRNISLDAARAEIFTKMAERSQQNPTNTRHSIEMGEGDREKFRRGALNWMLIRSGLAGIVAKHDGVDARSFDAGEFRGFSLMDLARESLVRNGVRNFGPDKMALVGRAFMERSTQSTSDFTYILENTMHKVLQASYALAEVTWPKFCAQSSVSDFRAHNRYRMGAFSVLDTVREDGEFKNKPITDAEKATITAVTKGNIINISRQMIVNDDMNAFGRLMQMLGSAAARSVEEDIYTLLAANSGDGPTMPYDSVAMFHTSSHGGNKTTGAALSAAALDADRVAMAKQKDKDSNAYLNLRPAILLVDSSLGGQARVINQSQYDPDTVANKSQMKPNVVAGLFREVVDSPYISNASFVNSATRRYLFADPAIAPVLEVAFLDGQSQPVIETQDGWRVDGTEMKIRFDYATAGVDHRGAVTNAGA